jgi:hypothetical protein
MNLLTFLFRLPLLPVRGFAQLANLIKEEAERELANPATIRHELEDAERAQASGEISDEQAADFQKAALGEFAQARRDAAAESIDEG